MKFKLLAGLMSATMLITGCGGGGNSEAGKSSVFDTTTTSSSTSGSTSVASNSQGSVVLSLSSTQISSSSPGTVTALVRDASNKPISGALVTFAVDSSIAGVSPTSVVTNNSGEAATSILPSSASSAGGAFVSASVEIPGVSTKLSAKVTFSVSALNVTLDSASATSSNLAAYASTNITFSVTGASSSNPVKILLSSTCAGSNKATISPATVTLQQSTGTVAYQDNGCATQDQVNVSIDGTSQRIPVTLTIAAPTSTSMQFVSATPTVIGIMGSGSVTNSLVIFKVTDQLGNPVSGAGVNFSLDQPNIATLTSASGTTGGDGTVTVGVNSKNTPSPVRVRATLASNSAIFVPSSELTINAGRPHQDGFSMAFEKSAMNGNLDGDESEVRLTLADRYGNPVPDGTRVNLVSEGGVVVPASCTTTDAVCKVKFVVSNPRPTDGRVAITAYAVGEETFTDNNLNLTYDNGEPFDDLGQVYLDKDESGTMAATGEYITGSAANGTWDSNTYVRETANLFFSVTSSAPRLFAYNSGTGCTSTPLTRPVATVNLALSQACTQTYRFCVRDANDQADGKGGNPIASGSTLAAETDAEGGSASVDNSPVAAIVSSPTVHTLSVKRASCGTALTSSGQVKLTIKTGSNSYTYDNFLLVTP